MKIAFGGRIGNITEQAQASGVLGHLRIHSTYIRGSKDQKRASQITGLIGTRPPRQLTSLRPRDQSRRSDRADQADTRLRRQQPSHLALTHRSAADHNRQFVR